MEPPARPRRFPARPPNRMRARLPSRRAEREIRLELHVRQTPPVPRPYLTVPVVVVRCSRAGRGEAPLRNLAGCAKRCDVYAHASDVPSPRHVRYRARNLAARYLTFPPARGLERMCLADTLSTETSGELPRSSAGARSRPQTQVRTRPVSNLTAGSPPPRPHSHSPPKPRLRVSTEFR